MERADREAGPRNVALEGETGRLGEDARLDRPTVHREVETARVALGQVRAAEVPNKTSSAGQLGVHGERLFEELGAEDARGRIA